MANYKQCKNGHYYDPTINSECPYCVDNGGDAFTDIPSTPNASLDDATQVVFGPPNPSNSGLEINTAMVMNNPYQNIPSVDPTPNWAPMPAQAPVPGPTKPAVPTVSKPVEDPLGRATQMAGMNINGGNGKDEDDTKFVVGWLVAIEGPYRGQSFELHNGYCFIGREKGDIVLKKDKLVSGEKNLSTVYDSENNCFYIAAGESRNVVHFNGKALLFGMSKEMNPYDSLKVGNSRFLFVPFCSERFNWRDGEKKNEKKEA